MFAEYDPAAGVMTAVMDRPDAPRRPTGAPVPAQGELVVLPLRSAWPDPYLPDLPELLGPMVLDYDADAGTLTQTFPAATYTPEAVRSARLGQADLAAHDALAMTDWAVLRQVETGKPMSAAVARRRAAIRAWHEATTTELTQASPAQLAGAAWSMPGELLQPLP